MKVGDACPESGCAGKLYELRVSQDVELEAAPAPVSATVYERQVLRCSSCQKTFTAPLPAGSEGHKYAPSVDAILVVLRYGMGVPHHRLARLQEWAGVPLPPSTQFERAEHMADQVRPVYVFLAKAAANSAVLHSDDTGARILELTAQNKEKGPKERTGVFTTGIVARGMERNAPTIVLYESGRRHAGENLDDLLSRREEAAAVIHMADASSSAPRFSRRVVANCLVHGRRYFVEAQEAFPAECQRVLDDIGAVYEIDKTTRDKTPEERLAVHKEKSAPILERLLSWIDERLACGEVEPNGQLGKAMQYAKNHWEGLTRFLRVAGVPLDNNPAERALKTPIRHRRSSLFYKTSAGAAVGDVLMSVIATCASNRVDPIAYLTAVARHPQKVRASPQDWLPWRWRPEAPTVS
jgi:transposase